MANSCFSVCGVASRTLVIASRNNSNKRILSREGRDDDPVLSRGKPQDRAVRLRCMNLQGALAGLERLGDFVPESLKILDLPIYDFESLAESDLNVLTGFAVRKLELEHA